jgi:hypothetical protein
MSNPFNEKMQRLHRSTQLAGSSGKASRRQAWLAFEINAITTTELAFSLTTTLYKPFDTPRGCISKMPVFNYLLACIPLIFPGVLLFDLLDNPIPVVIRWFQWFISHSKNPRDSSTDEVPPVSSQLLAYLAMGIFGYVSTNRLVPVIKVSEWVGRIEVTEWDCYNDVTVLLLVSILASNILFYTVTGHTDVLPHSCFSNSNSILLTFWSPSFSLSPSLSGCMSCQEFTLRKGIFGKDMGKRGTPLADVPV